MNKIFYYLLVFTLIKFTISDEKDKFGFIFLHDEKSPYDNNFLEAAKEVCDELEVEPIFKTNIPETEECYNTAKELVESGCKGVFADSFGHEEHILKAAKEFNETQFGHATGTLAHTNNLTNFHNAFASIYEGRYVTGIAAGMKLKEMIDNGDIKESEAKVGYVGAFPYSEVISGYTAFYLGVKSIVDSAVLKVRYTNSWYDEKLEKEAAEKLIDEDKCKIISQHADSQGAPNACESKGVPNVFYNGENTALNNSYLISSRINWRPYFRYFINSTKNNNTMDPDWTGSLEDGSVEVYNASSLAAEGTQDAVDKAIDDLKKKNIKVFDTSKFTVDGKTLTTYKADVDSDEKFEGDTEAISDGYFHESEYRSAPYFDVIIDGVEIEEEEVTDEPKKDSPNNQQRYYTNKKKKGLSGGKIAAIIVPIVAIIGIVLALIMFSRSSSNKPIFDPTGSNSNLSVKNSSP